MQLCLLPVPGHGRHPCMIIMMHELSWLSYDMALLSHWQMMIKMDEGLSVKFL